MFSKNSLLFLLTVFLLTACGGGGGGSTSSSSDVPTSSESSELLSIDAYKPLNDSGFDLFSDGEGNYDFEPAGYPGQDASFGWDDKAMSGTWIKYGSGMAGFDFSRVAQDGTIVSNEEAETRGWVAVVDHVTGLMWEVKTSDYSYRDGSYAYTIEPSDDGISTAEDYIAYFNAVDRVAGYTDWRLPTRQELHSLVHYGDVYPAIDTDYFPNTEPARYWSSDDDVNNLDADDNIIQSWCVDFGLKLGTSVNKETALGIRLVRDLLPDDVVVENVSYVDPDQEEPAATYTLNILLGTVRDNYTGLMWQSCSLGQSWNSSLGCVGESLQLDWQEALQYAEGARTGMDAGYSDWRLPNIKEIASIQNLLQNSTYYPMIDSVFVTPLDSAAPGTAGTMPGKYWSSTSDVSIEEIALAADFSSGGFSRTLKMTGCYVRLVRDDFDNE